MCSANLVENMSEEGEKFFLTPNVKFLNNELKLKNNFLANFIILPA